MDASAGYRVGYAFRYNHLYLKNFIAFTFNDLREKDDTTSWYPPNIIMLYLYKVRIDEK